MVTTQPLSFSAQAPAPSSLPPANAVSIPSGWCRLHLGEAEQRAVELSATGLPTKIVAAQLGKSEHTVRNQLANAMRKLGVRNRYELIAKLHAANSRPTDEARLRPSSPPTLPVLRSA